MNECILTHIDACIELLTKDKKRDAVFEALLDDIHTAMANAWEDETRKTYAALLARLYNSGLTSGAQAARVAEQYLGENYTERMKVPLQEFTTGVYRVGHDETLGQIRDTDPEKLPEHIRVNIEVAFDLGDKMACAILAEQNIFWVGEYYNEFSRNEVANSINKLLAEGESKDVIAGQLADLLGKEGKRGRRYFYDFTEHVAGRLRNLGTIAGLEKSTAIYAEVVAILDNRTSNICREMNGRLIPVGHLSDIKQQVMDIKTEGRSVEEVKNELKELLPFWSDKNTNGVIGLKTEDILRRHPGLSLPPYHWKCRTRVMAVMDEEFADAPDMETIFGESVPEDTATYVNNLTDMELWNKLKPLINNTRLDYDIKDLGQDFAKHGIREFGLSSEDEYLDLAQRARQSTEYALARVYKGELQFSLFSPDQNAMVVVGTNGVMRGCYRHGGREAIESAYNNLSTRYVKVRWINAVR